MHELVCSFVQRGIDTFHVSAVIISRLLMVDVNIVSSSALEPIGRFRNVLQEPRTIVRQVMENLTDLAKVRFKFIVGEHDPIQAVPTMMKHVQPADCLPLYRIICIWKRSSRYMNEKDLHR